MEKNERIEKRVEVTDLSISFMFKSIRVFYSVETSEGKVFRNILIKGEKYYKFITHLFVAKELALTEVLETEGKNDRMDKASE